MFHRLGKVIMNRRKFLCVIGCMLGLAAPAIAQTLEPALSTRTLVNVDPHAHYKVVYDIHSAETAAGISKGLFYARGLIEAFRKQGVTPRQLDIHLVLHGEAAQYLLIDTTYRDVVNDPFAVKHKTKNTQKKQKQNKNKKNNHNNKKTKSRTADD